MNIEKKVVIRLGKVSIQVENFPENVFLFLLLGIMAGIAFVGIVLSLSTLS